VANYIYIYIYIYIYVYLYDFVHSKFRDDIDGNPNGFAIHINDGKSPVWYLRADSLREKKSWLMRLGHVHTIVRWLDDFERVKVLGVGGTGIVYELKSKNDSKRYAMKEMEIKNAAQMKMALKEVIYFD
jgi:hypothetical protein